MHNKQIEEALQRLRIKVRKLVNENVRYLVSDPNDIRVGILAREQMEDWMVQFLTSELTTLTSQIQQEKRERVQHKTAEALVKIPGLLVNNMRWIMQYIYPDNKIKFED